MTVEAKKKTPLHAATNYHIQRTMPFAAIRLGDDSPGKQECCSELGDTVEFDL